MGMVGTLAQYVPKREKEGGYTRYWTHGSHVIGVVGLVDSRATLDFGGG